MGYVRQHYGLATTGKPTQEVGGKGTPVTAKVRGGGSAKTPAPPREKR